MCVCVCVCVCRYGLSSGQGDRLFARSDDGGETWAANWSFTYAELSGSYCEGSIVSDDQGAVYFGHPGLGSKCRPASGIMIGCGHDLHLYVCTGDHVILVHSDVQRLALLLNSNAAWASRGMGEALFV